MYMFMSWGSNAFLWMCLLTTFCKCTPTILLMARVYLWCLIWFESSYLIHVISLCLILIVHRCSHNVLPIDFTITRSVTCRPRNVTIWIFDKRKKAVILWMDTRILFTGICTLSHAPRWFRPSKIVAASCHWRMEPS